MRNYVAIPLAVAFLVSAADCMIYMREIKELRTENANLRQALDRTHKPSLFPHCISFLIQDGHEGTVCGNIESMEFGSEVWNKKEVKP